METGRGRTPRKVPPPDSPRRAAGLTLDLFTDGLTGAGERFTSAASVETRRPRPARSVTADRPDTMAAPTASDAFCAIADTLRSCGTMPPNLAYCIPPAHTSNRRAPAMSSRRRGCDFLTASFPGFLRPIWRRQRSDSVQRGSAVGIGADRRSRRSRIESLERGVTARPFEIPQGLVVFANRAERRSGSRSRRLHDEEPKLNGDGLGVRQRRLQQLTQAANRLADIRSAADTYVPCSGNLDLIQLGNGNCARSNSRAAARPRRGRARRLRATPGKRHGRECLIVS